ncbi:hypothetical protein [Kineococcus auxinigenes]|uniref:hypothetical protein n=1 Tax=Kineococcus sp. SYSU DK026 TaxID=3383147 RepID=UPI003D7E36E5
MIGFGFSIFSIIGLTWGIRASRRSARGELAYSRAVELGTVLCAVSLGARLIIAIVGAVASTA